MSFSSHRFTYLLASLALASLTMVACSDDSGDGGSGTDTVDAGSADGPSAETSQALFTRTVAPLLASACAGCHGAAQPPTFLAGSDPYVAITTFMPSVLDLTTPANSRLLTKGAHSGRAWTTDEAATILTWIQAEAAEQ